MVIYLKFFVLLQAISRSSCVIMQARIVLFAVLLANPVNVKRAKRIVGGLEILWRDPKYVPYNNVRYFAWIENGHSCDLSPHWYERAKWVISGWCAPRNDTLKCGGALITPQIIQTACHCAADFLITKELPWRPAVARNAWSVGYSVYLGLNNIDDFSYKLQVWSMWVHPKCAVLNFFQPYITHDFGWMQLDFKVQGHPVNLQGYHIDYAPLYNEATLERLFKETFAKELVCLIIGFGKVREFDIVGSKVMKHTWIQVLYPDLCYWITFLWKSVAFRFDWDEYNSWVCVVPFNKVFRDGFNSAGDSGSPITCDNNYFALVSHHMLPSRVHAGLNILMWEDPIKYSPKENAAEYRAAFIELVESQDWKNNIDDELRSLYQSQYNQFFSVKQLSKTSSDTLHRSSDRSSLASPTHITSISNHCSASFLLISTFFIKFFYSNT